MYFPSLLSVFKVKQLKVQRLKLNETVYPSATFKVLSIASNLMPITTTTSNVLWVENDSSVPSLSELNDFHTSDSYM